MPATDMQHENRRNFLQTTAAAVLASRALPVLGANDRINMVVIGYGGRGRDHVNFLSGIPDCRIAGICDVDQAARERGAALVKKLQGSEPKTYADMHQVFDDKSIDAVSFATPNHWHALGTIWACQAGKDVYVEKPACHNIFEGRQMIAAARKYKRIVQVGSQSRSQPHKRLAIELLSQGIIGKLYMVKGLCFNPRKSIGHTPDTPVPPGINWDIFLGPAPMRPFNMNRFHYNWHWFWDTGNGDIGNQGVHEMDIARWALKDAGLPAHVTSTGGKFLYQDDQETPNTQLATFEFGDSQLVFDVRGLITPGEGDVRRADHFVGNIFYGSEGFLTLDGMGFRVYQGRKRELVRDEPRKEPASEDTRPHMANFLAAVRSRDYKSLHADIEVGVASATYCHLANISYRVGRRLAIDRATGRFVNDPEANRMLTRNYRAPYVVPERV
jgi:predicted dehydrogenase